MDLKLDSNKSTENESDQIIVNSNDDEQLELETLKIYTKFDEISNQNDLFFKSCYENIKMHSEVSDTTKTDAADARLADILKFHDLSYEDFVKSLSKIEKELEDSADNILQNIRADDLNDSSHLSTIKAWEVHDKKISQINDDMWKDYEQFYKDLDKRCQSARDETRKNLEKDVLDHKMNRKKLDEDLQRELSNLNDVWKEEEKDNEERMKEIDNDIEKEKKELERLKQNAENVLNTKLNWAAITIQKSFRRFLIRLRIGSTVDKIREAAKRKYQNQKLVEMEKDKDRKRAEELRINKKRELKQKAVEVAIAKENSKNNIPKPQKVNQKRLISQKPNTSSIPDDANQFKAVDGIIGDIEETLNDWKVKLAQEKEDILQEFSKEKTDHNIENNNQVIKENEAEILNKSIPKEEIEVTQKVDIVETENNKIKITEDITTKDLVIIDIIDTKNEKTDEEIKSDQIAQVTEEKTMEIKRKYVIEDKSNKPEKIEEDIKEASIDLTNGINVQTMESLETEAIDKLQETGSLGINPTSKDTENSLNENKQISIEKENTISKTMQSRHAKIESQETRVTNKLPDMANQKIETIDKLQERRRLKTRLSSKDTENCLNESKQIAIKQKNTLNKTTHSGDPKIESQETRVTNKLPDMANQETENIENKHESIEKEEEINKKQNQKLDGIKLKSQETLESKKEPKIKENDEENGKQQNTKDKEKNKLQDIEETSKTELNILNNEENPQKETEDIQQENINETTKSENLKHNEKVKIKLPSNSKIEEMKKMDDTDKQLDITKELQTVETTKTNEDNSHNLFSNNATWIEKSKNWINQLQSNPSKVKQEKKVNKSLVIPKYVQQKCQENLKIDLKILKKFAKEDSSLNDLKSVRSVELSGSDISSCMVGFKDLLPNIEYLSFTNTKLRQFKLQEELQSLKSISFKDNTDLSWLYLSVPSFLMNLTVIQCAGNDLSELPGTIFQSCPQLTVLDLSRNTFLDIESIFHGMAPLNHLCSLNINDNVLANLDGVSKYCPNVVHLCANRNHLSTLELIDLKRLVWVELQQNSISQISPITNSPLLVHLDLSDNEIPSIINLLQYSWLPCLQRLVLSCNRIQSISEMKFPSLQTINLQKNLINSTLDGDLIFENCPSLLLLDMSGNPCDIRFKSLKVEESKSDRKIFKLHDGIVLPSDIFQEECLEFGEFCIHRFEALGKHLRSPMCINDKATHLLHCFQLLDDYVGEFYDIFNDMLLGKPVHRKYSKEDIKAVCKIQALWKGRCVRKWYKSVLDDLAIDDGASFVSDANFNEMDFLNQISEMENLDVQERQKSSDTLQKHEEKQRANSLAGVKSDAWENIGTTNAYDQTEDNKPYSINQKDKCLDSERSIQTVYSQLSKKEQYVMNEWGFNDPSSAVMMLQRARKFKSKSEYKNTSKKPPIYTPKQNSISKPIQTHIPSNTSNQSYQPAHMVSMKTLAFPSNEHGNRPPHTSLSFNNSQHIEQWLHSHHSHTPPQSSSSSSSSRPVQKPSSASSASSAFLPVIRNQNTSYDQVTNIPNQIESNRKEIDLKLPPIPK